MASGHVQLLARTVASPEEEAPLGLFDLCTCEWQLTQVLWFASAELNLVLPGPLVKGIDPVPAEGAAAVVGLPRYGTTSRGSPSRSTNNRGSFEPCGLWQFRQFSRTG